MHQSPSKAYNPITFVGDSVKRQYKFDHDNGVLYIY